MTINFMSQQIDLRLTPVGRPLGRNRLEASVFTAYSDNVKTRFVQELCGMIGGEAVYLATVDTEGKEIQTVPVTNWRLPQFKNYIPNAADFVATALANSLDVVVYGSDRARWKLSVKCRDGVLEAIDNQTDRGSAGVVPKRKVVEANGIRTEF